VFQETTKNRGLPLVRVIFGRPVDALLFDTGRSVQDFLTWFHNLPPVFGGLLIKSPFFFHDGDGAFMDVIGYIRVSSDKQDLQKQEHLLLKYAQQHDLKIDDFINIEISSRKGTKERRIDELLNRLNDGDVL
jgi:hypothetical protein